MNTFRQRLIVGGIAVVAVGLGTAGPVAVRNASATPVARYVVGWGEDGIGQTDPPPGLSNASAISAGAYHSLALLNDGTVIGWGNNDFGQATPPADLGNAGIAVAAGGYSSYALKSDGAVEAWGDNGAGQTAVPSNVTNVIAIAAGDQFALALESGGTVEGWGDDSAGQTDIPTGLRSIVAIAAGKDFSLALERDGTVVGWGENGSGQATPPVGLTGVVAIAAGWQHAIALRSDGTVVGWGANGSGQASPPAGLANVTAISAGYFHNLALKSDGTVAAWGNDGFGEASPPPGLAQVQTIAAGGFHSLAVTTGTGPLSVSASPSAPGLVISGTVQLTATAAFPNGTTQALTNTATWVSNKPEVATVSSSGLVSAVGSGQATISAKYQGLTGRALITVAAPTTTVQESALTVSIGSWNGVRDNFASGTSYRQSSSAGAVMAFHFTGTSLTWVTRKGPDQGIATVSVGGKVRGRFDLYSASLQEQAPIKISSLTKGAHELTLTVTGTHNPASIGNAVAVDAVKVGNTTTQDTGRALTWSGWAGVANSNASGGSYRAGRTANSTASLKFTGNGVDVVIAKGPAFGKMQVTIDGTAQGTVDLFHAGSVQWKIALPYRGLASGQHTATVTVTGTRNSSSTGVTVPLDAFIVHS